MKRYLESGREKEKIELFSIVLYQTSNQTCKTNITLGFAIGDTPRRIKRIRSKGQHTSTVRTCLRALDFLRKEELECEDQEKKKLIENLEGGISKWVKEKLTQTRRSRIPLGMLDLFFQTEMQFI